MKKTILLLAMLCITKHVIAQYDIISTFNSTHSGRSITLIFAKTYIEKNEFGLGLRYNINKLAHNDDQNNIFLKRQYSTSFVQHWGFESYYHRYFFKKLDCIKPYLFYDMQLSYSKTRNRMFLPALYDEELGLLYREVIEFFGPFTWLEQCIGIGIKARLNSNFLIYQKIGFGTAFIFGKDNRQIVTLDGFNWEFAGLIQAGLVYRLKK